MAIYLKFGEERKSIGDLQALMISGNVEAAKCLGKYYAGKRNIDNDCYIECITCYIYGAKTGCVDCMIKVSRYAAEFARILDDDDRVLKCQCVIMANNYAHRAFMAAETRNLRSKALSYICVSHYLAENNIDIIKEYIK